MTSLATSLNTILVLLVKLNEYSSKNQDKKFADIVADIAIEFSTFGPMLHKVLVDNATLREAIKELTKE